jgi:hypothetical protein
MRSKRNSINMDSSGKTDYSKPFSPNYFTEAPMFARAIPQDFLSPKCIKGCNPIFVCIVMSIAGFCGEVLDNQESI